MLHPSEEKWLALPVDRKLEYFTIHKRLVEAENKKLALLGELSACLRHSWMKSVFGDLKDHDEKWFFGLVTTYYARLRAGETEFCYRDVAKQPMEVIEIAIDWMTDYYKKRAQAYSTYSGTNNPVTVKLYQLRRDHERRTKPQEEN